MMSNLFRHMADAGERANTLLLFQTQCSCTKMALNKLWAQITVQSNVPKLTVSQGPSQEPVLGTCLCIWLVECR